MIFKEKFPLAVTLAFLIIASIAYFGVEGIGNSISGMASAKNAPNSIYQDIQIKLAFNEKGEAKAFALAKNNALANYAVLEGNPIPEKNSMVLGETEAEIMKAEKLFSKQGDKINGFFGISTSIEGVLMKTNSPIDFFHFLSQAQFEGIEGESGRLFLAGESPKNIYYKNYIFEDLPGNLKLAEGKLNDYGEHQIVGKTYYPVILGADEAKAMLAEKKFASLGDTFDESGKRFIIIGILKRDNSIFDIARIVPLSKAQLAKIGKMG
ncbi:MAG: hypothetical protein Q7R70_01655 [Candidatus Diapherotrites archaeon]|nr:hypothetical protein [Candidatus Diapherotrites archaeon]